MGEVVPPEPNRQLARAEEPNGPVSITLASANPNAPPRPGSSPRLELPLESERHVRAALEAGARAGTSLSELVRTIGELQKGVQSASRASEQLFGELQTLEAALAAAARREGSLAERVDELELELRDSRLAADGEREFLLSQQDEFIALLLEEHEEALRGREAGESAPVGPELARASEQLARAETARLRAEESATLARAALARSEAEREELRLRADKYERERDELRAEASRLRASLGTTRRSTNPPPTAAQTRPPSFRSAPALRLDDGELDATLLARGSTPALPAVLPRLTPTPLGRIRATRAVPPPPREQETLPPPIASAFPRESTRPGVGGPKPSESPSLPRPGWTPAPPAPDTAVTRSPWPVSAASLPAEAPRGAPVLKRKPDPTTRPLVDYSLGEGGVESETLEGAQLKSSKPPRK